jgi:integrase
VGGGRQLRPLGLSGLKFHVLRHTFVALWVAAGSDPKEVSVRAGHSSVAFTLDRYGHLYQETEDDIRSAWLSCMSLSRLHRGPAAQRRSVRNKERTF